MYILIVGNPFDGLRTIGTFDDAEEAGDYGNLLHRGDTWWVMRLEDPTNEEE
jgi:hypothetical protein